MTMKCLQVAIILASMVFVYADDPDPEIKPRIEALKAATCGNPGLTADKIERFVECDPMVPIVGKDILKQCHVDALGLKSMDDTTKKICAFKGDDWKDYHHKVKACVSDKGKDNARLKELEEMKKNNKEEFKKEKKDMMIRSLTCREQVLEIA